MSRTELELSRLVGDKTKEYLNAYRLLKPLLDEDSIRRIQDFIAGMQEAQQVIQSTFEAES